MGVGDGKAIWDEKGGREGGGEGAKNEIALHFPQVIVRAPIERGPQEENRMDARSPAI